MLCTKLAHLSSILVSGAVTAESMRQSHQDDAVLSVNIDNSFKPIVILRFPSRKYALTINFAHPFNMAKFQDTALQVDENICWVLCHQ